MKDAMNERRIGTPVPLHDDKGHLTNPGYATKMMFQYDRNKIHAGPLSLKEWDFYQIMSGEYILQLTFGHVSYVASLSATLFSLKTGVKKSITRMKPLPLRNLNMPLDPEVPNMLRIKLEDFEMCFETTDVQRALTLKAKDKNLGTVDIEITLKNDKDNEKMVIATPFANPRQFYLNEKENFYGVSGKAQFGETCVTFSPEDNAVLDWGRGVWPFRHEWFWGNGTGFVNGNRFGFNIGWGFGDLRHATENMFFWNGKANKLGALQVERDEKDYMAPWHFRDETGRFDFTMTPVYDNFSQTNLAVVHTQCHQVFGRFTGTAVLPDGEKIEVRDLTAFCEHAVNRW